MLGSQNVVVDAGRVRVANDYMRLSPTGDFQSVQDIGDLLISSSDGRLIRLRDIADIIRAYEDVPGKTYFINGKPGLSIGISMAAGQNVVDVGRHIDSRMRQLLPVIPIGMDLVRVYDQPVRGKALSQRLYRQRGPGRRRSCCWSCWRLWACAPAW